MNSSCIMPATLTQIRTLNDKCLNIVLLIQSGNGIDNFLQPTRSERVRRDESQAILDSLTSSREISTAVYLEQVHSDDSFQHAAHTRHQN